MAGQPIVLDYPNRRLHVVAPDEPQGRPDAWTFMLESHGEGPFHIYSRRATMSVDRIVGNTADITLYNQVSSNWLDANYRNQVVPQIRRIIEDYNKAHNLP